MQQIMSVVVVNAGDSRNKADMISYNSHKVLCYGKRVVREVVRLRMRVRTSESEFESKSGLEVPLLTL